MKTRAVHDRRRQWFGARERLRHAGERVREIDWAKAALARNPAYEIVATDESAGVFTVRDTATGTVQTLRLEDLIAAPRRPRPRRQTPRRAGDEPTEPVETPDAARRLRRAGAGQTTETVQVTRAGSGRIARREARATASRAATAASRRPPRTLEGPGYTITRQRSPRSETRRSAEADSAANVERRTDPIICQGDRLMRIDGETIEFTGDAVIAEKGCDLYISNARISAGGVGIIARQARVHIVNSTIGGTRGSYEASQGAEIYVARSTFTGVGRRFDSATMNDLGGNNSYEPVTVEAVPHQEIR